MDVDSDIEMIDGSDLVAPQGFVYPGQLIPTEPGFLQGRNTIIEDGKLYSTVCGYVQQVNKLIIVEPKQFRYAPEVGDLVIGRVVEIGQQKWAVDIGSYQHANLMLTAIQLHDSVQRRRTHQDALEMRKYFVENDILSCEVQKINNDNGNIQLHTRSNKYGKLNNGVFIAVKPTYIKRQSTHNTVLSYGVHVILGFNGYCYVGFPMQESASDSLNYSAKRNDGDRVVELEVRVKISRTRNCILVLHSCQKHITMDSIERLYAGTLGIEAKDIGVHNKTLMQMVKTQF